MRISLFLVTCVMICSIFCVSCGKRDLRGGDSSVIGIIGGSDGPTSIYTVETPDFLLRKGLDLIQEGRALANDSAYIRYSTSNKEIIRLIKRMASLDYKSGYKVFEISNLQVLLKSLAGAETGFNEEIMKRFYKSVPMLINSYSGSTNVAATSLLVCEEAFHYGELDDPCVYLYCFRNGVNSMVLFIPGSENITLSYATFVIHEALTDVKSADDVRSFFSKVLGVDGIAVWRVG